jgi:hypothetical protein
LLLLLLGAKVKLLLLTWQLQHQSSQQTLDSCWMPYTLQSATNMSLSCKR